MDLDTAADFLVGSIIFGLGFVTLTIAAVAINNILYKYWKKFELFTYSNSGTEPLHFVTKEEMEQIQASRANNETKVS
jgi:hypothetical protein